MFLGKDGEAPHTGLTTLLHFVAYFLASSAGLGRLVPRLRVPLPHFSLVAAIALLSMYFTNVALGYVDYVAKLMSKSIKVGLPACLPTQRGRRPTSPHPSPQVLPVAIFEALVVGRRYTGRFYAATCVLVVGLMVFLSGGAVGEKTLSHPTGKQGAYLSIDPAVAQPKDCHRKKPRSSTCIL